MGLKCITPRTEERKREKKKKRRKSKHMHPSLVFFFFCPSFSVHTYNTYKRRNAVIDCPALLGWLNEMLYNYSFCFFLREKKANSETLWNH